MILEEAQADVDRAWFESHPDVAADYFAAVAPSGRRADHDSLSLYLHGGELSEPDESPANVRTYAALKVWRKAAYEEMADAAYREAYPKYHAALAAPETADQEERLAAAMAADDAVLDADRLRRHNRAGSPRLF
jgi:hypothetical protein